MKGADTLKSLKYMAITLCAVMSVLSAGCGDEKQPQVVEVPPFFELTSMPETVTAEAEISVCKRFNEAYTTSLTASEEYGELLPFVGGYHTYKSTEENSSRTVQNPVYGLCTVDGAVVVDAVYDCIKMHPKDEGGFVYELVVGADGSDPMLGTRYIAASDGSWIFQVPKKCAFYRACGERIVFERKVTSKKIKYTYYDYYDYKGKKKFTFDKALSDNLNAKYTVGKFSEGFAPVNITVTDPETKAVTKTAYYINNTGKQISSTFTYCDEFKNGYAVVANTEGLYGVLDVKGEWFIEAKYRIVNYNAEKGYFACGEDGFFLIFNMKKEQVKKVFTDGDVEVINSERLIYKKTNKDTGRKEYFYADNDEPFACSETGQFPDGNPPVDGLFVSVYSGTGTVFNEEGKSIVSIGDFGYLANRFGNTVVVVNENGKKTSFFSVSTGKRTEWMRGIYSGQHIADRYIVLKNPDTGKYGVYDLLNETYALNNCDYAEVFKNGENALLSVVSDGKLIVYNSGLSVILETVISAQY